MKRKGWLSIVLRNSGWSTNLVRRCVLSKLGSESELQIEQQIHEVANLMELMVQEGIRHQRIST